MSQQTVEIVDPTLDANWDALAASHPENTVFHSSAWARVLKNTYGHQPFYFRVSVSGRVAAMLPIMEVSSAVTGRRGVSLPFSDFCGPLFFEPVDRQLLRDELSTIGHDRGWKYLELRGGDDIAPRALSPSFVGHTLDLQVGPAQLRAKLASAVRRNLRRAEHSGVKTKISASWEDLLAFYRLHMRTRRRHGLPPQSTAFFANVHEHVIKGGLGFVVLAAIGTRHLAAAVFLRAGKKALYKFGASDERFQLHRANNMVMWAAIRHLTDLGADTLDFGRTALDASGLRRFKLGWGTSEKPLVYAQFAPKTMNWSAPLLKSSGRYYQLLRRMPLAVNRVLGTLCYPHLD
jgi:CelD/BcsL family acetyltransferase involved in cellulose biosynthesis